MSKKFVLAIAVIVGFGFGGASVVRAQTISPEKIARGQKLYDEGAALMEQGKFNEACPKLEQAVALVPEGIGAKLELAACYEHAGRYASAWRAFKIAEAASGLAGQTDRQTRAKESAAAIEPKLSTLTILVPESVRQLPGFTLTRNGTVVDLTDWNTPIPVDGGSYLFVATAKGKNRWERSVEIAPASMRGQIEIGMLENAVEIDSSAANGRSQKTAGIAIAGIGLAGAAVGFVLGGAAISKNNASKEPGRCDAQNQCDQTGLDLRNDAKSLAGVSTGLVIAGGVLLGAGLIVWATAPKTNMTTTNQGQNSNGSVALELGPLGLRIRGTW